MAKVCPKCRSKYVDTTYNSAIPDGNINKYKCLSCGNQWKTIKKWGDLPNGEWLMSVDSGNNDHCVKFFRMDDGRLAMWLFDSFGDKGKHSEVVYGKHAFYFDSAHGSTEIIFNAPKGSKFNNDMHVGAIRLNPKLTKLALKNEAMRILYITKNGSETRFFIDTNNRMVLEDIASWLRSITGGISTKIDYSSGGCYIATAVYGSYNCPEVWTLRRYRDLSLSKSFLGKRFIRIYYSTSPTVVRLFGKNKWFTAVIKKLLDRIVSNLNQKGYSSDLYTDE